MSFATWIARRASDVVYAARLTVARRGDGQELDLYLATRSGQWDTAHNFQPYLLAPERLRHSAQEIFGTSSLPSYCDLALTLVPGRTLDSAGQLTGDELLAGWVFAGRQAVVYVGGPGLPWADWRVLLKGVMGQPAVSREQVAIPLASPAADLLDRQAPPNLYAEDSGVPEATVGKAIPLVLGRCRNIAPVLIDEAAYVYQFHDPAYGPVQAVDAVRVGGAARTAGFSVDLNQGTITFTADPAGQVGLDVRGRVSAALGGYVELVGDLVRDLLLTFGGAAAGDLDAAAFAVYNTARPWPAGLYLDRQQDLKAIRDQLLLGLLTYCGPTRAGLWTLRRLEETAGSPAAVIEARDIAKDSYKAEADELAPAWKVTVQGRRNWSVNSSPDDAVAAADREWLKEQYAGRVAEDAAVKTLYPRAQELGPHETSLAEEDHLAALAGEWLGLMAGERQLVSLDAKLWACQLELGDLVMVRRPRLGLDAGRLFRVTGLEERHRKRRMGLELWG